MSSGVYLTIKECADILKVSEQTIRNYIKRGDLKSYKFGVSHRAPRRILESDFNDFIGVNVYKGDNTDDNSQGDEAYMTIYSKVGNVFFREWNQEFPDFIFEFVFAHPCKDISLLSVDDRGYPDPDTASQFTHEEFCTLLATEGGDE